MNALTSDEEHDQRLDRLAGDHRPPQLPLIGSWLTLSTRGTSPAFASAAMIVVLRVRVAPLGLDDVRAADVEPGRPSGPAATVDALAAVTRISICDDRRARA